MPRHPHPRPSPAVTEAVELIQSLPANGKFTLEALQSQHDLERELACRELDQMAKQFAREDEKRKKLWGNKFPRVLGAIPPRGRRKRLTR